MNKEEFIKKYENKAVHCDTKEKANEFLELADSFRFRWHGGDSLVFNNRWADEKENTCYECKNGDCVYSSIDYYKTTNYEIIEYGLENNKLTIEYTDKEDLQNKINLELEKLNRPQFTEDEKAILRNLPKEYNWIARDANNKLYFYKNKPHKTSKNWYSRSIQVDLPIFKHIFQSIKFEDKEPCEFRKFLDE
ncbi:MAG: hypothetical protein M0R51_09435 [Clostridia bacterium]|jgi:hypothetical protein|nr:hypothetical protein [Clostridia bacterium]